MLPLTINNGAGDDDDEEEEEEEEEGEDGDEKGNCHGKDLWIPTATEKISPEGKVQKRFSQFFKQYKDWG